MNSLPTTSSDVVLSSTPDSVNSLSTNYNDSEVISAIQTILKKYEDGSIDLQAKDGAGAPPKYQKLPDDWVYPTVNAITQLQNIYYNSETGSLSCDIECENLSGDKV